MKLLPLAARAGGQAFKSVFAVLKLFRPDRPIHRSGVVLQGTLVHTRVFSGEDWMDSSGTEEVTARISRSVGLPESMPDVVGLALRVGDADILLSTTGYSFPTRFLLRPRRALLDGPFTSIMPFRGAGGPVLIAARREGPGPEVTRLSQLRNFTGELQWGLHYSRLRGPWTRFATVRLSVSDGQEGNSQGGGIRFDPVGRPPAGLETYDWTRSLRIPSYAVAQKS